MELAELLEPLGIGQPLVWRNRYSERPIAVKAVSTRAHVYRRREIRCLSERFNSSISCDCIWVRFISRSGVDIHP
jgi:hypothetical protein